jgi:type III secretion protein N (ATPase)
VSKYQEIELLLQIGEYKAGGDALADRAIHKMPDIETFLRQAPEEFHSLETSIQSLEALAT